MENQQIQHPLVNKFFYKFYNYNIEDASILDKIPVQLYNFVLVRILSYKSNEQLSHMDMMQFNASLYNNIKSKFLDMHDKLITDLKEE